MSNNYTYRWSGQSSRRKRLAGQRGRPYNITVTDASGDPGAVEVMLRKRPARFLWVRLWPLASVSYSALAAAYAGSSYAALTPELSTF